LPRNLLQGRLLLLRLLRQHVLLLRDVRGVVRWRAWASQGKSRISTFDNFVAQAHDGDQGLRYFWRAAARHRAASKV
jgi:hypothetical protein